MNKVLISNPEILGGTPIIKGTRIPVSRILFLLKDGYTVEAIQEEYPHIELKIIRQAIDEAIDIVNQQNAASLS